MASRLSFFLWESGPDDALPQAASRNELLTEAQIAAQAERMLGDDRAKRRPLGLPSPVARPGPDPHRREPRARRPQVDAAWTAATQASASQETELFIQNTLTGGGTLRDLLTSRRAWVDSEMARVYGIAAPAAPWSEVLLPASERAGLLTRTSFLADTLTPERRRRPSGATRSSCVSSASCRCRRRRAPISSQPMAAPDQGPQTNRMLFETRTSPPACQACHVALNGFGFGLENYNAAGHYQTTDDGLPVDASGEIHGTDVDGRFTGGIALSEALSKSEVVHHCATEEMVRYALGSCAGRRRASRRRHAREGVHEQRRRRASAAGGRRDGAHLPHAPGRGELT